MTTTCANVKIYNVDKMIQRHATDAQDLEVFGTRKELAVLEGPNGFVVTCSEGVSFREATRKASIPVGLCPRSEDGLSFYIMPTHQTDVPVGEILECESREQPLCDFIRRFGHRLESNYRYLLQAIEEIGLDPAEYPRGQEERRVV